MFKKFAIVVPMTVLALSSSMAFAADPINQVINIKATVPAAEFNVTPLTPGFGRDETMGWLPSNRLSDITETFTLKNTAANGSINALIDGEAKLFNGRDDIALTVTLGGVVLNDTTQEVAGAIESVPGVQKPMVIKAAIPSDTQSGEYRGSFAVVFEPVVI
ncbi:adhesin [Pseudomonas hormoni]|uniref:Adhesin n=1 Tax=Pseudomonas hormoni TaxID=3093767 RepID=A0ABX8ERC9_9PSED|nr:CS1 type fimbrial major subunit [Pseudomonas hormoni]QVW22336.1 adhesin [Pseudomonas hormoni]